MLKFIKKALKPQKSVEAIIAEIHNDFDTASERLLNEAKEILSKGIDTKGQRLKELGFVSANAVVVFEKAEAEKIEKTNLAEKIEYYRMWYPHNKFITEKEVKAICKKYGLLYAEVSYYKGDVPEKNLREIEAFKLREEDQRKRTNFDDWSENRIRRMQWAGLAQFGARSSFNRPSYYDDNPPKEIKEYYTKPSLCICAPEKDFDTRNLVRSGHKLELHIPDPVVLQPVPSGYLIVSKWGLEASDESLVNEQMN